MMSVTETVTHGTSSKRKRDGDLAELEVDLNAAEPPSKKALRKAKRSKTGNPVAVEEENAGDTIVITGTKDSKKAASNPGRSPWGIWIGNLSFMTTKDDLMTFLTTDAGHSIPRESVTRIHLPLGPSKHGKPQNKGFAYVDFDSEEALNTGLELSEKLLAGRRVLIKNARSFEGRPASKEQADSGKLPSRKIFVGNLAFDTTVETLEEHFGVCGPIQKSQVATFEDSGKCKGYAWVEFEQLSSAQAAMRGWVEQGSDGGAKQSKTRIWLKKMGGRQLRMEFAEDSTTRYNKRYGKDAKKREQQEADEEDGGAPITEVPDGKQEPRLPPRPKQRSGPRSRHGYTEETVNRLTGAITEAQGTKVTFDT